MRKSCFILLCTLIAYATIKPAETNAQTNQNGYDIKATITPLKNCIVYIYSYRGKYFDILDSGTVNNNSIVTFKGKEKLPRGICIMVSPQRSRIFEFLMDEKQHFEITADTLKPENVSITGSYDNSVYLKYTKFLAEKAPRLNDLQEKMKNAKTPADSIKARDEVIAINKEVNNYRDKVVKDEPNSMLSAFFGAMKRPDPPTGPLPVMADGKIDSLYPAKFVKEHFWDDFDFTNDCLYRTPFFEPKVDEYFRYYVVPQPDSVIKEVSYLLLATRTAKDMHRYLLGMFTDKYINPEIMGLDKVFLFLFDRYYSKGDTLWLNAKQKEYIFNRAYFLMANQIGDQAAALNLVDTAGKPKPLSSVQAPFTVVLFWDPNCGHCKEEVPKLDSIYEAKWHKLGVKIYAVNTDDYAVEAWKQFIRDHHLNVDGWIHAYQTKDDREADAKNGRANYRQLYDVIQTPTLYLLDKEKRIIAKKLSIDQFDEIIQVKTNQK